MYQQGERLTTVKGTMDCVNSYAVIGEDEGEKSRHNLTERMDEMECWRN